MDLINNRTKDIAAMALDGLYERSKAISANTVNALTPNYQRKEVSFEGSLREVIERENAKEQMKLDNSVKFMKNPKALTQTPEQISFLNSQTNEGFFIDVQTDPSDALSSDGNNVNLEVEMMDEAKTGMKYQALSKLLASSYTDLGEVIRGVNQ